MEYKAYRDLDRPNGNWYRRKERDGNILKNLRAYPYVKITSARATTKGILYSSCFPLVINDLNVWDVRMWQFRNHAP